MTTTRGDRQLGWIVLALIGAFVVLPALGMGFGMMGYGPMVGGMWDHGMWGSGDGVTGWMVVVAFVMQLLFLALVLGALYLGYRSLTRRPGATDPAVAELRQAYARGDLSDEQFEERRERLEQDA